jgi:hypothetical protein
MTMKENQPRLGVRLGLTMHVSALRIRLERVACRFPSSGASCLEDWLLDVANARGARIVVREPATDAAFTPPSPEDICNEELVVAICQLQGADRPQLLRLAAQLISREAVDMLTLKRLAVRERVGSVLCAMAREALKVDSSHPGWRMLAKAFATAPRPRDVVIHWTRLAEPVMAGGRCNAESWRLVA